ncbi:MAG: 50S ribosomal protein L11 methyltransferase [Hyphomicrobiales bacterium]
MTGIAGHRLTLLLPPGEAERIGDALAQGFDPAPDSVSEFEDRDGLWRLECFFAAKPDGAALARFLESMKPGMDVPLLEPVPEENWAAKSQAMLHPVRAGRFLVHGSHDRERLPPSRWRIEIDAGQAFGTAHHGSTLGCLAMLDRLGNRAAPGHVLDLGTGSGILAIAAARLWPCRPLATDIDPLAISVARDNARRNRAPHIRFAVATGLGGGAIREAAPYDLVCANILARPLIAMARGMARIVVPGGHAILSGITADQAAEVAAAYGAAGFARVRATGKGNWTTLLLRRAGTI